MNPIKPGRVTLPLIWVSLFVYILIIAKDQIMPVVLSLLLFFIILMIASGFRQAPKIGPKLNKPISIFFAFITVGLFFYVFGGFISGSVEQIPDRYPFYQSQLESIVRDGAKALHIELPSSTSDFISKIDLVDFSSRIGSAVLVVASNLGLIFFYLIFLFFEYAVFEKKMDAAFPKKVHRRQISALIGKIVRDISTYFRLKTAISFLVGALSYFVLKSFNVDLAEFWAILLFLLNFIPNVGSIIAVIFPVVISLIQFQVDAFYGIISVQFIVITSLLIAIQVFMGNVVEPRWLGNSLNLSPLVILVSLTIWGSIWGIVGMFLTVPFMVILNIVLANFDKTRKFAVFLSQSGKV